jgi:hypothetical protein
MNESNEMREWLEHRQRAWENGQSIVSFPEWRRSTKHEQEAVRASEDPMRQRMLIEHMVASELALNTLTNVLASLHVMLNEAGIPQQGSLTERVKLALARLNRAEQSARRWKAAAKVFRRRWLDAVAEAEDAAKNNGWATHHVTVTGNQPKPKMARHPITKPIERIIGWLEAVNIQPTDVYIASEDTLYASFARHLDLATLRILGGFNLKVETTTILNRYQFTFVPSPDDEV